MFTWTFGKEAAEIQGDLGPGRRCGTRSQQSALEGSSLAKQTPFHLRTWGKNYVADIFGIRDPVDPDSAEPNGAQPSVLKDGLLLLLLRYDRGAADGSFQARAEKARSGG